VVTDQVVGQVDLHVHSTVSADGTSSIADHARRAAELGLAEVGLCEHLDLDPRDRTCGYLDPARYDWEIDAARRLVPGVRLRQGIEITYQAALESDIRGRLDGRPWDFVIASVHLLDYADGWTSVSEARAVGDYFATARNARPICPTLKSCCGLYERYGRCGGSPGPGQTLRVTRYGWFDPSAFADGSGQSCARQRSRDGTEISACRLQPPGEPYPGLTVLRWFRELGGEILTPGSDAHQVNDLGAGTAEATELARAAGFRAVASFEARKVLWIDL
jgi:histidinol-phosphatase (PHP family)